MTLKGLNDLIQQPRYGQYTKGTYELNEVFVVIADNMIIMNDVPTNASSAILFSIADLEASTTSIRMEYD